MFIESLRLLYFMGLPFIKIGNARSPGSRHKSKVDLNLFGVTQSSIVDKGSSYFLPRNSGRNNLGHITVRRRGGGVKHRFRKVIGLEDFLLLRYFECLSSEVFVLVSVERNIRSGGGFVGLLSSVSSYELPSF